MKDLNELMQAILEMDAKQRQAADDAMEERRKELAALANEQTMLAQEYADGAKKKTAELLEEQKKRQNGILQELRSRQQSSVRQMQNLTEANKSRWVDELVTRALAR